MWYWGVSSLLVTAILASLCRVEANCTRRITITMTNNDTVIAPVVGEVVFVLFPSENTTFNVSSSDETQLYQSVTGFNLTITNTSGLREELTVVAQSMNASNNQVLEVTVRFDEDTVTCDNLLLARNVSDIPFEYSCVPISSCNSTAHTSVQSLIWQRRISETGNFMTLASNMTTDNQETELPDVITIRSNNGLTDNVLAISRLTFQSAAYYQIVDRDSNQVLHTFTLYHTPILCQDRDLCKQITANDLFFENAQQDRSIYCTFITFPNALVSWSASTSKEGATREDLRMETDVFSLTNTNITMNGRLLLSLNGRLTFSQVFYENASYYNCTATNTFDESTYRIRLRVKNPIRVVFPIVGTIASFIVTAIFIFGGYVVRKIFGVKGSSSDQTEYDVAFKRPQSVASDDDDNVNINRKVNNRRSLQPLVSKDSVLSTT